MRKLSTVLIALTIAVFVSCDKEEDHNFSYPQATISHFGFDFSAGASDTTNWENNDGEVIGWYPGGGSHPDYTMGVWWRNDQGNLANSQKDYGTADLAGINSAPAEWDTLINPLLVGHSYVVKCHDGYAKFEVLSLDDEKWEATVKYYFSSTNSFDE